LRTSSAGHAPPARVRRPGSRGILEQQDNNDVTVYTAGATVFQFMFGRGRLTKPSIAHQDRRSFWTVRQAAPELGASAAEHAAATQWR